MLVCGISSYDVPINSSTIGSWKIVAESKEERKERLQKKAEKNNHDKREQNGHPSDRHNKKENSQTKGNKKDG